MPVITAQTLFPYLTPVYNTVVLCCIYLHKKINGMFGKFTTFAVSFVFKSWSHGASILKSIIRKYISSVFIQVLARLLVRCIRDKIGEFRLT